MTNHPDNLPHILDCSFFSPLKSFQLYWLFPVFAHKGRKLLHPVVILLSLCTELSNVAFRLRGNIFSIPQHRVNVAHGDRFLPGEEGWGEKTPRDLCCLFTSLTFHFPHQHICSHISQSGSFWGSEGRVLAAAETSLAHYTSSVSATELRLWTHCVFSRSGVTQCLHLSLLNTRGFRRATGPRPRSVYVQED